jgi:hypothetical protein
MFVIKDHRGHFVESFGDGELATRKSFLRHGHTIWTIVPIEEVVDTMFLHKKDKVSRVRGKIASARVAGSHTVEHVLHRRVIGHKEQRVW